MSYPPLPPPEPPPQQPEQFAFRSGIVGEYRRAKKSATKLPKFMLLAATVVWPLAAFGWGQVCYSSSMSGVQKVAGDEYLVPWGSEKRLQSGQIVRMRADASRWEGIKNVSIGYAVIAAVCLAWWFYAQD